MQVFVNDITGERIDVPGWDDVILLGGLKSVFENRGLDYKDWHSERAENEMIMYSFIEAIGSGIIWKI